MGKTIRSLAPYLWTYRRGMAIGLSALLIKDLLGALLPLLLKEGVDGLQAGFTVEKALWFAGAMLGLTALKGFFQYMMRVQVIGASRDIEYDLRKRLYAHLVKLDPAFYARQRTGDILARATNDLNAVRMMLGPGVMYWTETSITFVLAVAVMLWVDWQLTLVALIPAPLISISVIVFGRYVHSRFEKIQALFSDISSRVQETLAGVRMLRAYAQEESEMRKFENLNRDYIRQNLRLGVTSGLFMPLLELLLGAAILIVLWVGGRRLLAGEMSIGTFLMFNFYMGMLGWPLIAMGWVVNLMQRGSASWGRLSALFEERPSIARPEVPKRLARVDGALQFESVTVDFGTARALDEVTLDIPAVSTVAIVGHTGSGKTTLVQLIPRMLDPTNGLVRIDGVDLRKLDPEDLRRWIGFVPQETFLFSATLAENIALGAPEAAREAILRAAEQAGLAPDIAGFPKGLDTEVGERGITLSGGQKQRVAIARALLRDPKILILDDALSSVDTATEERILNALREVAVGRTTIVVSHRVSTVRNADFIVVLDGGRTVGRGSHEELAASGGYYAELCQKQELEEELESA